MAAAQSPQPIALRTDLEWAGQGGPQNPGHRRGTLWGWATSQGLARPSPAAGSGSFLSQAEQEGEQDRVWAQDSKAPMSLLLPPSPPPQGLSGAVAALSPVLQPGTAEAR